MAKVTKTASAGLSFKKLVKPVSQKGRVGQVAEVGNFLKIFHPPSGLSYLAFSKEAGTDLGLVYDKTKLDLGNLDEDTLALVELPADSVEGYKVTYAAMNQKTKAKSGHKIAHKSLTNLRKGRYEFKETRESEVVEGYETPVTVHIFVWSADVESIARPRGKNKTTSTVAVSGGKPVVADEEDEELEELEEDEEESDDDSDDDEESDDEDSDDEDSDDEDEDVPPPKKSAARRR